MRLFAVGSEAVGVIAIGQKATGVVAVGQLATGVIAIGQLARGVVVVGQLGVGVVVLGQVAVGGLWAAGMLSLAPTSPGWITGPALFGRLPLGAIVRGRLGSVQPQRRRGLRFAASALGAAVAVALAVGVALARVAHELTRPGGILRDAPPTQLR